MMHVELGAFHHVHHNPDTCKPRHLKLWLTMLFHFPLVWLQLPRGLPNDLGIGVEVLWAGFEVLQGMS
jgi:hypothetical protein